MLRSYFTIAFLFFVQLLFSQNKVEINITGLPQASSKDDLYIAGSFNKWNPKNDNYRFSKNDKGNYFIVLDLPAGNYEYKITRGSWDKVESTSSGSSVSNRKLTVDGNEVSEIDIAGWQDQFSSTTKTSTASRNVQIIKEEFRTGELNALRRIWVYLPADYATSNRRYPVLYMHDGQSVFEDSTAFSAEWGVDEFMDSTSRACIVVAVDHGGSQRNNEYSPYDMERFGRGKGDQYVDFLVKKLKPTIDKRFRTLKKKENTFIAGSSMGGLISMYAILKYPKIFGGAGVFSPSFWIAPKIYDEIVEKGGKVKGKIYLYAGKHESESMVPDMLKAFEKMAGVSKAKMTTVIRDEGKHNESTWRKEFPLFYKWIVN